jgi:transcriptional regulator with XRE-family HTH domain
MSKMLEAVGSRLREERERLGFGRDQEGFADKAGISKTSLGNYENGKASMKVPVLVILDDIGVDILYVLTGKRGEASREFIDQNMLNMLAKLSMRERGAVFALVSQLAGEVVDLAYLQAQSDRRKALHDKLRTFRGTDE